MKTVAYKDYTTSITTVDTDNNNAESLRNYTFRVYYNKSWFGKKSTCCSASFYSDNESDIDVCNWLYLGKLPKDAVEVDSKYTDIPPI